MSISVTFRNVDTSEALKDYSKNKTLQISKYLKKEFETHVVLSSERYLHKAEVNIFYSGINIKSVTTSDNMYNSIDKAFDKIARQTKRYKDKLKTYRPKNFPAKKMKIDFIEQSVDTEKENTETSRIVESREFEANYMLLDEAIMQMDLLENNILVFLNTQTDKLNVLYRKNNNKFGLIEVEKLN